MNEASRATVDPYRRTYADLRFERAGLFEAIRQRYGCEEALYPGSSVHITPSLYFPHVVYVDRDPAAQAFFADTSGILAYVNSHKVYRRSAYIRFIAQDYTRPLPLREGAFDLLISLFAGGIAQACRRYLSLFSAP